MVSIYLLFTDTTEGITFFTTSVTSVVVVSTVPSATAVPRLWLSAMDAEASAVSGVLSLSAASGTVLCISGCAAVSFVTAFFARLDAVVTASKPIPERYQIINHSRYQVLSSSRFRILFSYYVVLPVSLLVLHNDMCYLSNYFRT
ncbi:MAG: hypothetical protein V8S42_01805 [Lachnospiraceae bacterium]